MKDKFSAATAFFGRGRRASVRAAAVKSEPEKMAHLSEATRVSVRALTQFSKISESKDFTAESAHKDFGHVKLKEVA